MHMLLAATSILATSYAAPTHPLHASTVQVAMSEVPSRWRAVSRGGTTVPSFTKVDVSQAANEILSGQEPATDEIASWYDAGIRLD